MTVTLGKESPSETAKNTGLNFNFVPNKVQVIQKPKSASGNRINITKSKSLLRNTYSSIQKRVSDSVASPAGVAVPDVSTHVDAHPQRVVR